jgi:hypothetical protein
LNTHDKQGGFLRTDAQRNSLKARIPFGMHLDLSIIAEYQIERLQEVPAGSMSASAALANRESLSYVASF